MVLFENYSKTGQHAIALLHSGLNCLHESQKALIPPFEYIEHVDVTPIKLQTSSKCDRRGSEVSCATCPSLSDIEDDLNLRPLGYTDTLLTAQ